MSAATKTKAAQTPALKPIPFNPRRGLFVAMAIVNVLWIATLVWMYFATVRNAPNPRATKDVQSELQRELDDLNATTRPGADGSPSAPR
jgi:hypothetical protein